MTKKERLQVIKICGKDYTEKDIPAIWRKDILERAEADANDLRIDDWKAERIKKS